MTNLARRALEEAKAAVPHADHCPSVTHEHCCGFTDADCCCERREIVATIDRVVG